MKSWIKYRVIDFCYVTDFVANGSFASLRLNVTYINKPDYAVLLRLTDFTKRWNNDFIYVSKASYEFLKKSSLKPGDLIMSNVGEPGIVFLVPDLKKPMTLGPNSILIRPNEDYASSKFLLLYFSTEKGRKQINEISSGAAQKKFNKTSFRELEIPLPPLPVQKRMVAILDEALAVIEKAKANAEQNLKNARELFEHVLDSILNDKKWKVKQLGDVCEKVEYGTSSKAKSQGKLPVLRMGNIQNGRFVWDSLVFSDNEKDNKEYLLTHNDVLFNRTNSLELVGKTAIYKSEMPAIYAGYLIRIHRKQDLLDADYLNYYLNSKMAFEYGKTVVISSVNQANINGTKLKTYPIPLPTLREQQAIVRLLDALTAETNKLESIYQQKLNNLEELKKSILQKAFNGELETDSLLIK